VNAETSDEVVFFFSLKHFREAQSVQGLNQVKSQYLGLGDKMSDWYEKGKLTNERLYRDLIQEAKSLYAETGFDFSRNRSVEILIGHICYHLVQRISRSMSQLECISGKFKLSQDSAPVVIGENFSIPESTSESMSMIISPELGEIIDRSCTQLFFRSAVNLDFYSKTNGLGNQQIPEGCTNKPRLNPYRVLQKLAAKPSSRSEVSVISPYLGKTEFVSLNLLLGQIPAFVEQRRENQVKPAINRSLGKVKATSSLEIAVAFLRLLIPASLLESYSVTLKQGLDIGFPKNPKVVFTSNAFFYDDLFKVHVASSESKAFYVVGQHGNNYGVSDFADSYPEVQSPDLFLSWGWAGDDPRVIPFGLIKPKIRAKPPKRIRSVTLIVRDELKSFLYADMEGPNSIYVNSVIDLCSALDELHITTSLRLHSSSSDAERAFWQKSLRNMSFVSVSSRNPSIAKLVRSGVGIVFTYDSTGMLELASAEIPFFCFIPDGLGMVKGEFQKNYQILSDAGLLSENPKISARLILNWIDKTKDSKEHYQTSMAEFVDGISFYPKNKLWSLRKLLIKVKGQWPQVANVSAKDEI
jgi:putative transferase (TIGR04331 family)